MQGRFDALCQRIEAGYSGVPEAEVLEPQVPDEQLLRDMNDLPILGTLLAAVQVCPGLRR